MHPRQAQIAFGCVCVGSVIAVLGGPHEAYQSSFDGLSNLVADAFIVILAGFLTIDHTNPIMMLGMAVCAYGWGMYAYAKGYTMLYGFAALLPVAAFYVLFMKDKLPHLSQLSTSSPDGMPRNRH